MNKMIASLAAGSLLALAAAAPTLALPAEVTSAGACDLQVNAGVSVTSNHCQTVTLKQDARTGAVTIRLSYPADARMEMLELSGPAIQLNPTWTLIAVKRLTWVNSGAAPQTREDSRDTDEDEVAGRCSVALKPGDTDVDEVHCAVKSDLGDVRVEFKFPREPKT